MTEKIPYLTERKDFVATRNACKLCSPLGASIAFKGVKGCIPLIHGSQGCATYIRRYLISHYKEPVDIASSNFSEETTIFGGHGNLKTALTNVISQYEPEVVGVATTCLSETIGDDVDFHLKEFKRLNKDKAIPQLVHVSSPSYQGSHMDGFHETVAAIIKTFARKSGSKFQVNLFPGFVSPEDIREMKQILNDFKLDYVIPSDYSDTLDNPTWENYNRIPKGGTPVEDIMTVADSVASIEFGTVLNKGGLAGRVRDNGLSLSAGQYLKKEHSVNNYQLNMPIGITATDKFFEVVKKLSGNEIPEKYIAERGRLVDAYIDGHKYVFGKKAVVYGEEDFVIGMCAFLDEIGVDVVLAASGGESNDFKDAIRAACPENGDKIEVLTGLDFEKINELSHDLQPDMLLGNSKGNYIAQELGIPLVRVGFPIHDRMGGQRICHLSYRGTQALFDMVTNAMIEQKQNRSSVGYKYM